MNERGEGVVSEIGEVSEIGGVSEERVGGVRRGWSECSE